MINKTNIVILLNDFRCKFILKSFNMRDVHINKIKDIMSDVDTLIENGSEDSLKLAYDKIMNMKELMYRALIVMVDRER